MANEQTVVEINYTTRAGTDGTVYFSERGFHTGPSDTPASTIVEGRLVSSPRLTQRMQIAPWGGSAFDATVGAIDLANGDGELDYLLSAIVRDKRINVYRVAYGDDIDSGTLEATVLGDRVEIAGRSVLRLVTVSVASLLDKPLRGGFYNSTTPNTDLDGKAKPIIVGEVFHARPVVIDGSNLLYQIHDGEVDEWIDVRDRGAAMTVTTEYTTNDLLGTFDLTPGGSPSGQVTATVRVGANDAGSVWSALMKHADVPSYMDTTSWHSFITGGDFSGGEFGFATHPERPATILDAVLLLADSYCGALQFDPATYGLRFMYPGESHLSLFEPSIAGNPIIHVDECASVTREFDRARALTTGYAVRRNWHPHSDGSIAGVVTEETGQLLAQPFLAAAAATDTERLAPEYRHALDAAPRATMHNTVSVAEALVDREVGLYREPMYFWRVAGVRSWELNGAASTWEPEPGDSVVLKGERFGLDYGVPMTVAEVTRNLDAGSYDLVLWGSAGRYTTRATHFPGSQYLDATGTSMGISDSTSLTFCCSVRSTGSGSQTIIDNFGRRFQVRIDSGDGHLHIYGENSSGTTILDCEGTTDLLDSEWHAILVSVAIPSAPVVYIDDRREKLTVNTLTHTSMDLSQTGWRIGADNAAANTLTGQLAHLGLLAGTALDFTDRSVRRRFFDELHRPVYAGSDGSTAFGSTPQIWVPDGFGLTNAGSGGDFTRTAATVTTDQETAHPCDGSLGLTYRRHNQESHYIGSAAGSSNVGTASASDDSAFTFCAVFRFTAATTSGIFNSVNARIRVNLNGSAQLRVRADNSSGTKLIGLLSDDSLSTGTWYAVLVSVDVSAGTYQVYVNDAAIATTLDASIVSGSIDFSDLTSAGYEVGHNSSVPVDLEGDIAHVGLLVGTALDLSKPAIRRRFFDRHNRPVYAGDDGSLAFGTTPTVWHADGKVAGTPALSDEYPTDQV